MTTTEQTKLCNMTNDRVQSALAAIQDAMRRGIGTDGFGDSIQDAITDLENAAKNNDRLTSEPWAE